MCYIIITLVGKEGFEPTQPKATDLQSVVTLQLHRLPTYKNKMLLPCGGHYSASVNMSFFKGNTSHTLPSASRPRGSFRIASALHYLRVRSCESWSHFSSCGRTLSDYESERLIAQAYTIMLHYVQRLGANLEWKVGFEPTALEFCSLLYWASLPLPHKLGSGRWICTTDLQVMSLTSCYFSIPQ